MIGTVLFSLEDYECVIDAQEIHQADIFGWVTHLDLSHIAERARDPKDLAVLREYILGVGGVLGICEERDQRILITLYRDAPPISVLKRA